MTRVKICGIQGGGDALTAARAGADFVGLVFVPNRRRRLDEERAMGIVSALRENLGQPPKVVGLFADQPLEELAQVVRRCGLDMVQLCGAESLEYCDQAGVPVIKVVHVPDALPVDDAATRVCDVAGALKDRGHTVTLDRQVEGLQGGTGQSFNWAIAQAVASKGLPFFLAGGLTPENVGAAVRTVGPWGVDVSSGVETGGVKDASKIGAFVHAVRAVTAGE